MTSAVINRGHSTEDIRVVLELKYDASGVAEAADRGFHAGGHVHTFVVELCKTNCQARSCIYIETSADGPRKLRVIRIIAAESSAWHIAKVVGNAAEERVGEQGGRFLRTECGSRAEHVAVARGEGAGSSVAGFGGGAVMAGKIGRDAYELVDVVR